MKPVIAKSHGLYCVKEGDKIPWASAEPFYRLSAFLNELNELYPSFEPDEHWFCRCSIYKHQVAVAGLCEFCKKNSG